MRTIEPIAWDDYVLAFVLVLIAAPRVVMAVWFERPLGVEGTFSIAFIVLALLILWKRRRSARPAR